MTNSLDRLWRELHLPTVLAQAQTVAIEAERSGWSFTRYLYTLAEWELEQRRQPGRVGTAHLNPTGALRMAGLFH